MYTPMANAESLRIGSVEYVSPDEIIVLLDVDAPADVAMNTGIPRPFPRINSYVLIPSEYGFLVGQIEWITIERSQFPKRKGIKDFGIIDLPFPLRKMNLNPLGILKEKLSGSAATIDYEFSRGIEIFPTVGDPVLLPTQNQLRAIVETGSNRRVQIGISPLAGNAVVSVDPDRLFGRHLAILGNTGSGKSCSVAGLIRWSIEAAKTVRKQEKEEVKDILGSLTPEEERKLGLGDFINSRFIILDPNGEYSAAFDGLDNVNVYSVDINTETKKLEIPIWFWNSMEWGAFTQASAKTQMPILRRALREIRYGVTYDQMSEETKLLNLRRYLSYQFVKIRRDIDNNTIKEDPTKFGKYLQSVLKDLRKKAPDYPLYEKQLDNIMEILENILSASFKSFKKEGDLVEYYTVFNETDIQSVLPKIKSLLDSTGGLIYLEKDMGEDVPLPFKVSDFIEHVKMLGIEEGLSQYIDFLVFRMQTLIKNNFISAISESEITLSQWLNKYISPSNSFEGSITVIDLSHVPAEVVHIITAVIARMILEALQRYRKLNNGKTLPTVIVMEEAHTFIKKYYKSTDEISPYVICTQVFEKIAREGRKFGLGLVLSSQRPNELSPTVLSQCNSFLLHRISNDQDQDLVKKLVPDNLRGLLRELPALPSRNAILLGWASELPVYVRINYLDEKYRPKSDDPEFWDVWTGKEVREVNWDNIASEWQNSSDKNS